MDGPRDEGRARALRRAGLRVLAVARRRLPTEHRHGEREEAERDLVRGLVALFFDPPRPEVAEAVSAAMRRGIRILVVTGDYGLTAAEIAVESASRTAAVVTGEELERMSERRARPAVARGDGADLRALHPRRSCWIADALRAEGTSWP